MFKLYKYYLVGRLIQLIGLAFIFMLVVGTVGKIFEHVINLFTNPGILFMIGTAVFVIWLSKNGEN